jgi:hypothetical protein
MKVTLLNGRCDKFWFEKLLHTDVGMESNVQVNWLYPEVSSVRAETCDSRNLWGEGRLRLMGSVAVAELPLPPITTANCPRALLFSLPLTLARNPALLLPPPLTLAPSSQEWVLRRPKRRPKLRI